jgi:hypothetical protein
VNLFDSPYDHYVGDIKIKFVYEVCTEDLHKLLVVTLLTSKVGEGTLDERCVKSSITFLAQELKSTDGMRKNIIFYAVC